MKHSEIKDSVMTVAAAVAGILLSFVIGIMAASALHTPLAP